MPPQESLSKTDTENHISKPLLVIGVIAIILTVSAFVPARWFGISSTYKNKKLDLYAIPSAKEVAKDVDNDGIISWQEIISQNMSSDDISQNTSGSGSIDNTAINQLNDPNNLTGSFSKNFYLTSLYLQKNNVTDESVAENAIKKLIQQEAEKIIPTTYTLQDLNVASSETKTSLIEYGNIIAPILDKIVTQQIIADDLASINSFTQSNEPDDLSPIQENVKRVDMILKNVLTMSVPPSAVSYHILLLTRVALYRDTLRNISEAVTDPIRSTIATQRYADTVVLVVRLNNQFASYFNTKNIVFSAQDAGYVFTVGYTKN